METNAVITDLCESNDRLNRETIISEPEDQILDSAKIKCDLCVCTFSAQQNLKRHMKNIHKTQIQTKGTLICPQHSCDAKNRDFTALSIHLFKEHSIIIESEEFNFKTEQQFMDWKTQIQSDHLAQYVKHRGQYKNVQIFHCNRSSTSSLSSFKSKSNRKRTIKRNGSIKIGKYCPSRIRAYYSSDGIEVKYFKTHVGHTRDPRKIGLTSTEKLNIASKLIEGIPKQTIISKTRETLSQTDRRMSLINRQDIANIERKFKISIEYSEQSDRTPNARKTTSTPTTVSCLEWKKAYLQNKINDVLYELNSTNDLEELELIQRNIIRIIPELHVLRSGKGLAEQQKSESNHKITPKSRIIAKKKKNHRRL